MSKKTIMLIMLLAMSAACIYMLLMPLQQVHKIVVENSSFPTSVYFCPGDDCMDVLINLTRDADTVDCAFYDLDLVLLIQEFESGNAEKRLVIDYNNHNDNRALLANLSDMTRLGALDVQMHNKFCVFDKSLVATGSFNPTKRGNYKNNNNLIIIHSRYLAENYEDEFNELWHGINSRGEKVKYPKILLNSILIENYFCPEDCSSEIYTRLIDKASDSIMFMTFSFTDDDIGNALIHAHDRGVAVKGIFEKSQNSRWTEYEKLNAAGVDVHWDKNKANMHHKVFVIDNRTVITGSANPTGNGLLHNDENIIVLHDENIAHKFLQEFDRVLK